MDFLFDLHTHAIGSGHAYSTVQENIRQASDIGLRAMGMSDHGPKMPGANVPYYFGNQAIIPDMVYGVRVFKGCELNIMGIDGSLDLYGEILENLDFGIASLHPPCIPFGTIEENTEALVNTMQSKKVNIIGHPGDPRYPIDIPKVVQSAIETGTLLEINNASLKPTGARKGGESIILDIIKECKKKSWPVIMGSDAHVSFEVGDFRFAYKLIEEAEMPQELVLNTSMKLLDDFLRLK